ncbi:MAG: hypothetical protein KF824_10905 [Fimbriimonadaceae bacterium]|nr:MAG: hypothetical protein KF824_10905 [Fimbriimonadaceae bacterium]
MIIPCPKCGQQIPATLQTCQFCGAIVSPAIRSAARAKGGDDELEAGSGIAPKTVWAIYGALCWFLILTHGTSLMITLVFAPIANGKPFEPDVFGIVSILIDVVFIIIGICLLAKVERVRDFVTTVCAVGIIFNLWDLLGNMALILGLGIYGVILTIMTVFSIIINGGLIWSIYETQRIMAFDRYDKTRVRR